MKVIGAGFPRTGTMSTQAALIRLGFPCYHMQQVPQEPGHLDAWNRLVSDDGPMDWRTLFADYQATVDGPACFYYRELLEEFPEAKVLLNVRDAERWYASISMLLSMTRKAKPLGLLSPKFRNFVRLTEGLVGKFLGPGEDQETFIRGFHAHIEAVQREVPSDKLLVFEVTDGWEPLCAFLGCDVPDEPFPRLNEGDATLKEKLKSIFGIDAG